MSTSWRSIASRNAVALRAIASTVSGVAPLDPADAGVVERHDPPVRCERVDQSRIPVVEVPPEMLEQNERRLGVTDFPVKRQETPSEAEIRLFSLVEYVWIVVPSVTVLMSTSTGCALGSLCPRPATSSPHATDIDDRLGKGAWGFLRQVMSNATLDDPVLIRASEFAA